MPVTLPSSPKLKVSKVSWRSSSLRARSPLSSSTQTSARVGAGIWVIDAELPPMSEYDRGQWEAALFGADGFANALSIGPEHPKPVDHYDANAPKGSSKGATVDFDFRQGVYCVRYVTAPSILVDGAASAQATSLAVDGADGVGLNAGDWISVSNGSYNELHMVTADAFPDASGDMTLTIHPALRRAVSNNAAVTIEYPQGEFLLASNDEVKSTKSDRAPGQIGAFTLEEFVR